MQAAESEHAVRMQSMLRLNLSVRDGLANVYWKHDGERFAGKSKQATKPTDWRRLCSSSTLKLYAGRSYQLVLTTNRPAKIRHGSGRWDVKEIDSEGREVQPQFEVLPLPPPSPPPAPSQSQPSGPAQSRSTSPSELPPGSTHPYPQPYPHPHPSHLSTASCLPPTPALYGVPAASTSSIGGGGGTSSGGGDDASSDPRALRWVDVSADSARSTFTCELRISLAPSESGRRQYLLLEAYVEDFGLCVCPVQIKVYRPPDKNALTSFPLRFVQFDFREDSSYIGDLYAVNYHKF